MGGKMASRSDLSVVQTETRRRLEEWATNAGPRWSVRDAKVGLAYRLYHGEQQIFYCSIPAASDYTTVLILGATESDLDPVYDHIPESRRFHKSRDGTRVRVWPDKISWLADWDRARRRL